VSHARTRYKEGLGGGVAHMEWWTGMKWQVNREHSECRLTPGVEWKPRMVPFSEIGGGGNIGMIVRTFVALLIEHEAVIEQFGYTTSGRVWTIFFTLDSHWESFTVDENILRTLKEGGLLKSDMRSVLSKHLYTIRNKRQMEAQQKAEKAERDAKREAKKAAKWHARNEKKKKAATLIQSMMRGYISRKKSKEMAAAEKNSGA